MSNEINEQDINEQDIKELQSKNQKVVEGAIKINTQIESAQVNHKKTQELAISKFQTANTEELKAKVEAWKAENKKNYNIAKEKHNKLINNYNETLRLIKEIQEGQQ